MGEGKKEEQILFNKLLDMLKKDNGVPLSYRDDDKDKYLSLIKNYRDEALKGHRKEMVEHLEEAWHLGSIDANPAFGVHTKAKSIEKFNNLKSKYKLN